MRWEIRAFTLIELLVVVTIIVVLISLLIPTMDKAIYQTELAVCAARLKGISSAAFAYSGDFRRHYPRRNLIESSSAQPSRLLASYASTDVGRQDDRGMLKGYLATRSYLDPLVRPVDLDLVDDNSDLFVGYSIWFGFRYKTLNYKGLKKIGDRLEWRPVTDTDKTPRYFKVIASDIDFIRSTALLTASGHPDAARLMKESVNLNAPAPAAMYRMQTNAWWTNSTAAMRGPVDYNYAYDDGSIQRLLNVEWNEWEEKDRIVRVGEHSALTNEHPDYNQLPRP